MTIPAIPAFLADRYCFDPDQGLCVKTPRGPQVCTDVMLVVEGVFANALGNYFARVRRYRRDSSPALPGEPEVADISLGTLNGNANSVKRAIVKKLQLQCPKPTAVQTYLLEWCSHLQKNTPSVTSQADAIPGTPLPHGAAPAAMALPQHQTPQQRDHARRRLSALAGWDEPTLSALSNRRFAEALQQHKEELDDLYRVDAPSAVIRQRSLELDAASGPGTVFLCWHHINAARHELVPMADELAAPDGALFGNQAHRVKVLRALPSYLRTRLEPAFDRGDIWDPDGALERGFDQWEEDYAASMPKIARSKFFAAAVAAYHAHHARLVSLLDEMLALFPFQSSLNR